MTAKPKPARELAARALCRMDRNPEDSTYKGKPMWMDYLPAADAVLEAIGWREPTDSPALRVIAGPKPGAK
jgi:hypothetical protein